MTVHQLFKNYSDEEVKSMVPLPSGGSGRRYWRIKGSEGTIALGVKNDSISENLRYLSFSEHFLKARVRVPKILARSTDAECYLVEDLGKTTLLKFIHDLSSTDPFGTETRNLLKDTIEELHRMHNAIEDFPFHLSFPKSDFDSQMIRWDLYYFKYCFLKILDLEIDEIALDIFFEDLSKKIDSHRFPCFYDARTVNQEIL